MCNKGFLFPKELKTHQRTHTKKGLIPCTWPKCKKLFTANKSMFQHLQAHSDQKWYCKKCDPEREFEAFTYFRQHEKGFYSAPSFRAYCGTMWKWPYMHTPHQKECRKCEKIKIDKSNRPENPRKFRIRKSKKETVAN